MSPELQTVLDQLIADAKQGRVPYTEAEIALLALTKENRSYTLFYGDAPGRIPSTKFIRQGDILVGFQAEIGAEVEVITTFDRNNEHPLYYMLPLKMKGGEFNLAWRNLNVFPSIMFVYSYLDIRIRSGIVKPIFAHLDNKLRKGVFQPENKYELDNEWRLENGMLFTPAYTNWENHRKLSKLEVAEAAITAAADAVGAAAEALAAANKAISSSKSS